MNFKSWLETTNPDEQLDQYTWYHGRTVDSDVFSYDYVGQEGALEEGAGFYFTNNFDNAKVYAQNRGIVLKCRIDYKNIIEKNRTRANKKVIEFLINNAPEKEDTLTNFAENPREAINIAINLYHQMIYASDAYQTIEADFYKNKPKEYLQALSKFYDVQITLHENSLYGDIKHLIVYNPSIIHVIQKIYL